MKRRKLYLDGENLLAFEPIVDGRDVEVIKGMITRGKSLPPVEVVEGNEGVYEIRFGARFSDSPYSLLNKYLPLKPVLRKLLFLKEREFLDPDFGNYNPGGHHRAVAYYQLGVPMDCRVFRDHRSAYCVLEDFIPLKSVRMVG